MKCVVTGGCGFLGSRFVKRLLEDGNEVIVYDNLSSGQSKNLEPFKDNKNYSFIKGGITDKNSLSKVLTKGVNIVFHMSAIVGVKEYCKDPLKVVDVNVIGTRNVLEFAAKNNIKWFIEKFSISFDITTTLPFLALSIEYNAKNETTITKVLMLPTITKNFSGLISFCPVVATIAA